ncbi:hypothetical protein FB45DRAFT_838509 [Roridomyces roridus]|uniref:Cyclochlorotine biosynthesis protein O n=1 Tax=Roridomyces roridus TaxID=1738132 RepID=A0AAD7BJ74_9AGAR|nr:hypothetical protein FB45DRAFT_838509 [Roridomyces roridus]
MAPKGDSQAKLYPGRPPRLLYATCMLSVIINLAAFWLLTGPRIQPNDFAELEMPYLYSPAQHAVRQIVVKFTRGLADDIPIYERHPSTEVDEAWRSLYSVAENKISEAEAVKMPNHTWPLYRMPGNYMIALDVFHQLHCLDMLRQRIHHSSNYNYTWVPISHLRHCIGAIRQALMCASDISTVVFQWSEQQQIAEQRDDVLHMCRDFEQIRGWAAEHQFVAQEDDFNAVHRH